MVPVLQSFLAQTAPSDGGPFGALGSMLPLVLIFVVFYYVLIRPQQKAAKQQQADQAALKKGDEVLTNAGIIGTVASVEDRTVTLDVGQGNKLRVVKSQIAGAWKPVEDTKVEAKK